jgi:hypothetical protein
VINYQARDSIIVHAEQDSGLYVEVDDPVEKRDLNIGTPLYPSYRMILWYYHGDRS